jgi:hypothetical protein
VKFEMSSEEYNSYLAVGVELSRKAGKVFTI